MLDYKSLLPNWWSQAWAKAKLAEFSTRQLNDACRLLTDGCFYYVSAGGRGPIHCYGMLSATKLRCNRYSSPQKVRLRNLILSDREGCDDLRKGIMNEALWEKIRNKYLLPQLAGFDELSLAGRTKGPNISVYTAAELLYAAWLVSCDPALMFAWRGVSLYGDLGIQSIAVKPLPSGAVPARELRLPVPAKLVAAPVSGNNTSSYWNDGYVREQPGEQEPKKDVPDQQSMNQEAETPAEKPSADNDGQDRSEVIKRWASGTLQCRWLSGVLPRYADFKAAEELAPQLHSFEIKKLYGRMSLAAAVETPEGETRSPVLIFSAQGYGASRIRAYLRSHEEDCFSLERNSLSEELADTAERLVQGFSDGSRDRIKESWDPAALALALRAASAMSKYPRLMFLFRGVSVTGIAEGIRKDAQKGLASGRRGTRRQVTAGDLPDGSSDAPGAAGDAPSDELGSAPWARSWITETVLLDNNENAGDARAALREGRAGDFKYDEKEHRTVCEIADEFGDRYTVTLSFGFYSEKERGLIGALLYLNEKRLKELREGRITTALRKLFSDNGLKLLPDGHEKFSVSRSFDQEKSLLPAVIKASQLMSADPSVLLKWRGFDLGDESTLDSRSISADALLGILAPGPFANRFISFFVKDPLSAPLADAGRLLSGKTIGAPDSCGNGSVSISFGRLKSKKTAVLALQPFTCAQAAALADRLDRNYGILQELGKGGYPEELDSIIAGVGDEPGSGTLTVNGEDVTREVSSDPALLAVILRLAQELGKSPALLFAWRGLPLGRVPIGQIRAGLIGKSPDEPFLMAGPQKPDRYLELSFAHPEPESEDGMPWWAFDFLRSSESSYGSGGSRAVEQDSGDDEGIMHFLPNQHLFYTDVADGSTTERLYLALYEFTDHGIEVILDFFRERPELIKALGQGYLDRSFRAFARPRDIPLLEISYDEFVVSSGHYYCSERNRSTFVRRLLPLLEKDPSLIFLCRGLDIKKELGLGSDAALQEPEEEPLRAFDEADQAQKRTKDAAALGGTDDFIRKSFARRFIAYLADDAIIGYQRDAKASRICDAVFDSIERETDIDVRHGSTSNYTASLQLEPLTEEEQKTVLSELREDPGALSQLQVGKLDEQFVRRLQSLGVPLMCGDSIRDRMWCSCEVSDNRVCRHEIALLKRTAQRVLSDPALLFSMRGFDISKELHKLSDGRGVSAAWMAPEKLFKIHPELDSKDTGDMLPDDALYHLNRASFAKVPSGLLRSAMRLLEESPAGYGGEDCKGVLLKTIDSARECARIMIKSDTEIVNLPDFSGVHAEISSDGHVRDYGNPPAFARFMARRDDFDPLSAGYIQHELGIGPEKLQGLSSSKAKAEFTGYAFVPPDDGFSFEEMHSLPSGVFNGKITAGVLDKAGTAAQAMYALCSLPRKLLLADAVMPCALRSRRGELSVMWIPCLLSHEVLTLTAHTGMLARKLLLGSVLVPDQSLGLEAEEFSDAGFGALCLGMFISDLVRKGFLRNMGHVQTAWNRAASETPELLLLTLSCWCFGEISKAALERMESSLGQWLAPLFIGLNGMRPVLILGTSVGPEPDIASAEERLRAGGEQAIADAEKAEDEEAKGREEDLGGASVEEQVSAEITLGFIDREDGRYVSYSEVSWLDAGKRGECRAAAARISALLPEAADIISGKSGRAVLSIEALQKALFEILPALKLSGALVVLPRSMRRILRPQAMANLALMKGWKGGSGLMSLTSLLSFNWKATLGGREITEEQFEELRKHAGHLVRFGNDYVYASASEIDSILRRLSGKAQRPSRLRLLEAALSGSFEGNEVFMDEKIRKAINEELKTPPAKVPDGLKAELRPYQERGYSWLMHNLRARMGSIIADDMGLGKTVQVIAALESLRSSGELDKDPALVTVPASVVINWTRELRRFAPGLTVNVYYGTQRSLEPKANVLLTTYGTLRQDIEKLKDKKWRVAVADEAQNIKNPGSQIFQDMCIIRADSAIAMSGTPVENRLADYWAIMEFVNPGLFGTLGTFVTEYAQPIERSRDADAVRRLRGVTAPFILRRLKTDKSVIADLPDKISSDRFCALTPEQAAMYQTFVSDGIEGVTETLAQLERSARVLKLILRLKQICDAPELFSKDPKITGPEHSGKAEMLLDLLEELTGNGQKAIVFTQFREMGDLLVSWIGEKLGTVPDFIHGGVSVKKRQEMVDRFQNDPQDRVMVLSLKAAGTGLNLTAATAVIHYDLWWNPAVEDQATDRAYRIGQDKNVMVYRFICAGTFEEKINEMINSKKEIAELTVQKGEKWRGDLSKSELRSFLAMSAG